MNRDGDFCNLSRGPLREKLVPPQAKKGIMLSLGVENESLCPSSEQASQESFEATAK
jgi:hypothetical protein